MAERCPLEKNQYWQCDTPTIPEVCIERCEALWELASIEQAGTIDTFSPDCEHGVEYGDTALQRGGESSIRHVGVLSVCMADCGDAFAVEYRFECPNN